MTLMAQAQQNATAIVGSLNRNSPSVFDTRLIAAFWQGMADMGYVEGQIAAGIVRWAEGPYGRLSALRPNSSPSR